MLLQEHAKLQHLIPCFLKLTHHIKGVVKLAETQVMFVEDVKWDLVSSQHTLKRRQNLSQSGCRIVISRLLTCFLGKATQPFTQNLCISTPKQVVGNRVIWKSFISILSPLPEIPQRPLSRILSIRRNNTLRRFWQLFGSHRRSKSVFFVFSKT